MDKIEEGLNGMLEVAVVEIKQSAPLGIVLDVAGLNRPVPHPIARRGHDVPKPLLAFGQSLGSLLAFGYVNAQRKDIIRLACFTGECRDDLADPTGCPSLWA